MLNLLIVIIVAIFVYALYNLINFLRYSKIEYWYTCAISSDKKDIGLMHKTAIVDYVKKSGIKDMKIPMVQALGFGQVATGQVSVFKNFLNNRSDVVQTAIQLLLQAKGNYWSHFLNSINPFFWLQKILYLPKTLLEYFGVSSENFIIKIFQFIYWLIGIVATVGLSLFPDEIKSFFNF